MQYIIYYIIQNAKYNTYAIQNAKYNTYITQNAIYIIYYILYNT